MKQTPEKETGHLNRSDMKKLTRLLVLAAVLLLVLNHIQEVVGAIGLLLRVLSPFLLGSAIAFVLNVPMRQIEKGLFGGNRAKSSSFAKRMARPVSLVLTLLAVAVLLALFCLVLVPQMSDTMTSIAESAQTFIPQAQQWVVNTFEDNPQIMETLSSLEVNWDEIVRTVSKALQSGLSTVLSSGLNAAVSVVSGLVNFFIGLIFACYVLMQKEKLADQSRRLLTALLPAKKVKTLCRVASMSFTTFSSFIRGQCLEAVILGVMFVVAMSIFRLPYALMVGVLIAFTALIPVFGAFIGCALSALMILMVNPMQALIFIILFLVLQQIEGNLIYPHVVGNSVGLPSLWVLVAVTVGGSLMGVVGMLLFIPLASVGYALLRDWVNHRNALRKEWTLSEEHQPVPPEEAASKPPKMQTKL